jgi:hypothetical protein
MTSSEEVPEENEGVESHNEDGMKRIFVAPL